MEKNICRLALGRKEGEGILIGDNIRVIPIDIGRGKVRIVIEAPADVLVLREELKGTAHDYAGAAAVE